MFALIGWDTAPAGTALGIRLYMKGLMLYEAAHQVVRKQGEQVAGEHVARNVGFVFPMYASDGFTNGTYQLDVTFNGSPDESVYFSVGGIAPGTLLGEGDDVGPIPYKDPSSVLVITRASVLRQNMGAAADDVLAAAAAVGDLHDLDETGFVPESPEAAAQLVRDLLRSEGYHYLLIVGNDDAVPFFHLANPYGDREVDELEDSQLPAGWLPSDDPYTDLDGDQYQTPDIATARIPSSDDPELLLTQLGYNVPPDGHGYALVNQVRRSQAGAVVSAMSTASAVQVDYAPPANAAGYPAGNGPNARYLYVLLHGIGVRTGAWSADVESWIPDIAGATSFDGEWQVKWNGQTDAITVQTNPGSTGVISVGACYGAWTIDTTQEPTHKTAENSLALQFLNSGSRAFVADTHLSYSANLAPDSLPIARTGFEMVYWRSIGQGMAPIDAFQQAKIEISQAINQLSQRGQPEWSLITEKTLHYMVYLGRP